MLPETRLTAARPANVSMDSTIRLTTIEYDDHNKKVTDEQDGVLEDKGQHQRLIGKQLYLTIIRRYIAYIVRT